jgi:hypothetical protein
LVTDSDYYQFNKDSITHKAQQKSVSQGKKARVMLEESNFEMEVQMMPSGEKAIKCLLKKHKIVMRTTILLMVSNFFGSAFPKYTHSSSDKPNFYSSDPNCAKR